MSFVIYLVGYILIGGMFLMLGKLLSNEPKRNFRSMFVESLVWGAGFVLMMSVQVVAIASMH